MADGQDGVMSPKCERSVTRWRDPPREVPRDLLGQHLGSWSGSLDIAEIRRRCGRVIRLGAAGQPPRPSRARRPWPLVPERARTPASLQRTRRSSSSPGVTARTAPRRARKVPAPRRPWCAPMDRGRSGRDGHYTRTRQRGQALLAVLYVRPAGAIDGRSLDRGGTRYRGTPSYSPRVPCTGRPTSAQAGCTPPLMAGGVPRRRAPHETGRSSLFISRAITAHPATSAPGVARLRIDPGRRHGERGTIGQPAPGGPLRPPGVSSRTLGLDAGVAIRFARPTRVPDEVLTVGPSGVAHRPPAGALDRLDPERRRDPRDGRARRRRDGSRPLA
jgi:hypothetical protein